METVKVFRYRWHDFKTDSVKISDKYATEDFISAAHLQIIQEDMLELPSSGLDPYGRYTLKVAKS